MELTIRHIVLRPEGPSSIIELTVSDSGTILTARVTNSHGNVDPSLIIDLRQIADELEEQNIKIKNAIV